MDDDIEFNRLLDQLLDDIPMEENETCALPVQEPPLSTREDVYFEQSILPVPEIVGLGPYPKYQAHCLNRGASEDTYFEQPIYQSMVNNHQVLAVISYGSDEEVLMLPNLSNQTPRTKPKCDQSLENKLFIDATCYLIFNCSVRTISEIYRRLGTLSDRVCLGCKVVSLKTVCLCGKFRCHHCVYKGHDVDFATGFSQWLQAGCPSRHTINVT